MPHPGSAGQRTGLLYPPDLGQLMMLIKHSGTAYVVSAMLLFLLSLASGDVYYRAALIKHSCPFLTCCAVVWYTGEGRAQLQRPTDSD